MARRDPHALVAVQRFASATSGVWSSTLHVRGRDDPAFTPREPPASDLRVVVAAPHDGRRVYLCTWGEGVHFSPDGGRTWQSSASVASRSAASPSTSSIITPILAHASPPADPT